MKALKYAKLHHRKPTATNYANTVKHTEQEPSAATSSL